MVKTVNADECTGEIIDEGSVRGGGRMECRIKVGLCCDSGRRVPGTSVQDRWVCVLNLDKLTRDGRGNGIIVKLESAVLVDNTEDVWTLLECSVRLKEWLILEGLVC